MVIQRKGSITGVEAPPSSVHSSRPLYTAPASHTAAAGVALHHADGALRVLPARRLDEIELQHHVLTIACLPHTGVWGGTRRAEQWQGHAALLGERLHLLDELRELQQSGVLPEARQRGLGEEGIPW
jgi:hypothetical protein